MKKNGKASSKATSAGSPKRLQSLQKQQRRLRKEIKQLKAERDQYKKSLLAMMAKDTPTPFNKKELLALVGKQPPLRALIAELEAQGG